MAPAVLPLPPEKCERVTSGRGHASRLDHFGWPSDISAPVLRAARYPLPIVDLLRLQSNGGRVISNLNLQIFNVRGAGGFAPIHGTHVVRWGCSEPSSPLPPFPNICAGKLETTCIKPPYALLPSHLPPHLPRPPAHRSVPPPCPVQSASTSIVCTLHVIHPYPPCHPSVLPRPYFHVTRHVIHPYLRPPADVMLASSKERAKDPISSKFFIFLTAVKSHHFQ